MASGYPFPFSPQNTLKTRKKDQIKILCILCVPWFAALIGLESQVMFALFNHGIHRIHGKKGSYSVSYAISNLHFKLRPTSQHTAKNNTYETIASFSNKQLFCVFSVFRGFDSLLFKRSFRVFRVFRGLFNNPFDFHFRVMSEVDQ